jgi:3-oxoadipate enol-lactonase
MQLAAKWQRSWTVHANGTNVGRIDSVYVGCEWVEVARLGRGEPIVLVPGLAGSWKLVLPLARALARHFEVIVPALRGDRVPCIDSGSQAGTGFGVRSYAADLAYLMDRLALERPAVVGVSFGGAIALQFAAEFPHRLSSLVVSGVESRFHRTIGSSIARRALERFPLPRDNPFINQFFHLLYGTKPEPGPLVDFVVDRIWETDQNVMAHRLAELESFDISDQLWRIDVPTLVVAGARDVIVPVARQRALSETIVGARFALIPNAGHVGFLTNRAQFVSNIRRHVRPQKASV